MKITLGIITLNEEENLRRCLASIGGLADEILIVDSGSTDRTRNIAEAHRARWVSMAWEGYVRQKNAVLRLATHPWVLSLDADEALSPELLAELRCLKSTPPRESVSGYSMPRCVRYEGRWIRHGDWYPDRLVRFFLRERARFSGGRVHEKLEVAGTVLPLSGEIEHHSFRDREDHWNRCVKYARLWAEDKMEQGRSAGPFSAPLHAGFRLLRAYFLKAGFLDGAQGWHIARTSCREVFLKYSLLRAMRAGQNPWATEGKPTNPSAAQESDPAQRV